METKENRRETKFELVRIVAMLMIIAHHFSVHGGFEYSLNCVTLNKVFIQFFSMGGKIGVNLFVLISGYFLILGEIKVKKVLHFWLQLFFYSVGIYSIFLVFGITDFNIKQLIKCMMPITFSQWWFASTYFVMYLFSPYLNKLLHTLNKNEYLRFLITLLICTCLIPTFTRQNFQSNSLIWFIVLYFLAGFIRLYGKEYRIKGKMCIIIGIIIGILLFCFTIACDILGMKWDFFAERATCFYGMQELPIVIMSVMLFLGFVNSNIKYNKYINKIATITFGVYLIHDNNLMREFIWKKLFCVSNFSESVYLIPYALIVVGIVFIVCACIELLRIHFCVLIDCIIQRIKEKLGRRRML